jgi:hypothetical protein
MHPRMPTLRRRRVDLGLAMAWRFRRSLKLGPLRLNFSKSGIGYSAGVRGFRVGQDAKGRTYTAASTPGTGL